jgi:hypothetical protein
VDSRLSRAATKAVPLSVTISLMAGSPGHKTSLKRNALKVRPVSVWKARQLKGHAVGDSGGGDGEDEGKDSRADMEGEDVDTRRCLLVRLKFD